MNWMRSLLAAFAFFLFCVVTGLALVGDILLSFVLCILEGARRLLSIFDFRRIAGR